MEFGILPQDYAGRVSHRWHNVLLAWLGEQWNQPDRHDYHLMRIAQRVQQVLSKHPNKVTLDHQRVEFRHKKEDEAMTVERATALSKARRCQMLGRRIDA